MSILDDIQRADNERRESRTSVMAMQSEIQDLQDECDELVRRRNDQDSSKIVLDPKLDPDPWGYHGISLVDRLKAMGWP
jgi:hypothetical protein